jgi:hypothetical protein
MMGLMELINYDRAAKEGVEVVCSGKDCQVRGVRERKMKSRIDGRIRAFVK